jgi:tetratricopeptide (TPR) repeat protein
VPDLRPALLALAALHAQAQAPDTPRGVQAPAPASEDARVLLLRARALQLKGKPTDLMQAVSLYRRVVAMEPKSAEAQLRLAEALRDQGELEEALVPARRAIELAPENAEGYGLLGLLQYQRAKMNPAQAPQALKDLHRAGDRLPQDVEVWWRTAEVAEQVQDKEESLRAWARLARLRPSVQEAWVRTANYAKDLGRYEIRREAVMMLNQRKPIGPEGMQALRLLEELAQDQVKSEYLGHAEDSFLLLSRHLPEEAGILENVALLRLETQRWAEALEALDKAIALKAMPRLTFNRAVALMNLGRMAEAERDLKTLCADPALKDEADRIREGAPFLRLQALLLLNRHAELLAALPADGTSRLQGEFEALHVLVLVRTGKSKEALEALRKGMEAHKEPFLFREARALPPEALQAGLLKGKALDRTMKMLERITTAALSISFGQWEPGLSAAREARALGKAPTAELATMEAQALDQLGRKAEAIKVLQAAERSLPPNATLQNNLGYLLLETKGDLAEATRLISEALKQEPDNGSFVDSLGWAQHLAGKEAEAEITLKRAAQLRPFSAEVRTHYGEVLLKNGKPKEAAEQWERALAFASPDRKALEKRLAELRVRLAKEAQDTGATPSEPAPAVEPDGDGGEEE